MLQRRFRAQNRLAAPRLLQIANVHQQPHSAAAAPADKQTLTFDI